MNFWTSSTTRRLQICLQFPAAAIGSALCEYGYEKHLISSDNGSVSVSYVYDPLHRQIQKNANEDKTRFFYSGWQRLADYDGTSDAIQCRYVYGTAVDEPLILATSEGEVYLYADGLGSVTALANESGVVTNRYKYSPFGESDSVTDAAVSFTGQRFDEETKLYYFKHRYYNPRLGRFLQPDPIGYGPKKEGACGCECGGSCDYDYGQLNS